MATARQPVTIALVGGASARLWAKPHEQKRRRKSNAALIADFAALKKALMLCATCEAKLPQRWMSRYGYRLLRDMHTQGRCDYCQTHDTCNIFHHEQGGYVEEWDRLGVIEASIKQQKIIIRDKRRVR